MDGLTNVVAGLGTSRDKRSYSTYVATLAQSPWDLENIFRQSWLGRRIVTTVADDMTREKAKLDWDGYDDDEGGAQAIERAESAFGFWDKVNCALQWGRLYGGCVILMVIKGDKDLSQPLDVGRLGKDSLQLLHVLDRRRIVPGSVIEDDLSSPNFGLPRFYDVAESFVSVHWSRIVRFGGQKLPYFVWQQNQYWDDSVLQAPLDSIKNYDTATGAVAAMMWEANVDVLKTALTEQLSQPGGEAAVETRLVNAMTLKSINHTLVIDKESEEFEQKQYAFGGIHDVILNFVMDVCGAADIPATRLFGMSPAGLNATGESDLRNYYDHVSSRRETALRPQLMRLYEVLVRSTLGSMPENFKLTFPPLWQVSDKEEAEIGKIRAETDEIYRSGGVLTEGAIARELLDRGTYRTIDDVDVQLAKELALQPEPAAPAQLGPDGKPMKQLPAAGNKGSEPDAPAAA